LWMFTVITVSGGDATVSVMGVSCSVLQGTLFVLPG